MTEKRTPGEPVTEFRLPSEETLLASMRDEIIAAQEWDRMAQKVREEGDGAEVMTPFSTEPVPVSEYDGIYFRRKAFETRKKAREIYHRARGLGEQ